MDQGRADIFITYCSNAVAAQKEVRRLKIVAIPPDLQIFADYGLTVRCGAHSAAQAFADALLTPNAQAVFVRYGFVSP
jgi:accessory colonization factor AcfC